MYIYIYKFASNSLPLTLQLIFICFALFSLVSVSNANEALIITTSGVSGIAGAQLGGRRGGAPLPFFENKKNALILEKGALIVSVFGLNFLFQM